MNDPPVSSQHIPLPVHEISFGNLPLLVPADKFRVVSVRNEADLLAVRFLCHGDPGFPGHFTDLILFVGTHRHQRMGQLLLGQTVKGVGLILGGSGRPAQGVPAVFQTVDSRVVTGGDGVRPQIPGRFQHGLPLHIPVADHAGIGRSSLQVFPGKIIHHMAPELPVKIQHMVFNAQGPGHPGGIFNHRGLPAAVSSRLPGLHSGADHLIPFLFQQPGCHGGIHASGQPYHNLSLCHQYSSSSSSPSWISALGFSRPSI